MIQQVVIVSGGVPSRWPDLSELDMNQTAIIGVDRGVRFALEAGFNVDIAVGDFDSLTTDEFQNMTKEISIVKTSVPEKDDTDTELGVLMAMEHYPGLPVIIIGGTGGRIDHFLCNLWFPLQPRFSKMIPLIHLWDKWNKVSYFHPGDYEILKDPLFDYLAFVCFTPVTGLYLREVKYPLNDVTLYHPMSYASNEFLTEKANFSFHSGIMGVIQSMDETFE